MDRLCLLLGNGELDEWSEGTTSLKLKGKEAHKLLPHPCLAMG